MRYPKKRNIPEDRNKTIIARIGVVVVVLLSIAAIVVVVPVLMAHLFVGLVLNTVRNLMEDSNVRNPSMSSEISTLDRIERVLYMPLQMYVKVVKNLDGRRNF